jgi:hypothetical protein
MFTSLRSLAEILLRFFILKLSNFGKGGGEDASWRPSQQIMQLVVLARDKTVAGSLPALPLDPETVKNLGMLANISINNKQKWA